MLPEGERTHHALMAESFDPSSALIAREKVTGYLLSHLHPVGRYKAAFFARLGYSADAPEVFERDVAALLRSRVIELGITPYGRKLATRGMLRGPIGGRAVVLAVWIILPDERSPRLVTVYPED